MSFFENEERELVEKFLKDGFVTVPLEQAGNSTLSDLRKEIFIFSKDYLNVPETVSEDEFFNHTQKYLEVSKLNDLKLSLMPLVSKDFKFHGGIYRLAKKYIDIIVGNELCMQRGLNLSVQLPHDDSALLPLHTDVWSGNSPYEVVLWLPLIDCYKTKSMYVLPLDKSTEVYENFQKYESMDAESFYKSLEKDLIFLDVPKGHAVIFSHSIIHGNRVNEESETRWTFNIRFKSVLTPFGTKDLGEAFIPVTLRPVTRIGYHNKLPSISR
jgi:sporadic carbohydrate cluster 2OG-Fe(II) oxygenase